MTVTDLADYRQQVALDTLARLHALAEKAATEEEASEVAAQIRAFIRKYRASKWEPYPWQRPHVHPPGWVSERDARLGVCDERCLDLPLAVPSTHGVWLNRGGRGGGKTEGAAHYVNAHAEGPPCDPRVPGGHRFTIVGPTQPDTVSACVTGVSGLQAINPAITVTVTKEGTLVRWPNGAVGRILGGNTAKDVQRARAWTNVCVAEGSWVETEHGRTRVEEVRAGDRVWTRTGLRRVIRAESTGVRPVVRVTADGADVWVTPDHPVARPDGTFTRADAGGTVLVWTEQGSPTTASPGLSETTGTTGTGSGSCTGTSTSASMGLSPRAGTSTTRTTTRRTTPPATSAPSAPPTTRRNTPRTAHPSGTPLVAAPPPLRDRTAPTRASSVGSPSFTDTPPPPGSARLSARTGALRHEHTSHGCAACAAAGTPAPAGTRPAPAPRPAEVSPPTRLARVYDLAVEGHHEFYAGGLLVGNCVWWVEEAAAIPYLGGLHARGATGPPGVLDQAPFTLRLHSPEATVAPHIVATTTPTGREEVTVLIERAESSTGVQTWGRTRDAYRLDPDVRLALETAYPPGTTLARQELDGEQVGDVAGALWVQRRSPETPDEDDRPGIDNDRVPLGSVGWTPHGDVHELVARSPEMNAILTRLVALLPEPPEAPTTMVERVAVGVDPAGGSTENGISVVGSAHQHGYTLADLSLHGAPATWGMLAVLAAYHFGAEGIALERTYGGDQTDHSIATAAEELGLPMPALLRAPTVEGKKQRATPVQALAQVHRLHHVGVFPKLEGEQTTWVEDEPNGSGGTKTHESPNRLDAWVHAVRHLLVRAKQGVVQKPTGRRVRSVSSTYGGGAGRR